MAYSFPNELVDSNLGPQEAARTIQLFQSEFLELLWRDLAAQGHIQLTYMNREPKHVVYPELYPVYLEGDSAREALSHLIDDESVKKWGRKSKSFDFDYAQYVLRENPDNFSEFYSDYVYDEEFSEFLLGYAIGCGLADGDLEVVEQKAFSSYLETIYDEQVFYKIDLEITGDVPWEGLTFSELSPDQQLQLVTNFLNSREGSDKDWANAVVPHLLDCMSKHDLTADNVKAFIRLNLPN